MRTFNEITSLEVKKQGCYNVKSRLSYKLTCNFPNVLLSQLFPQGITIINSESYVFKVYFYGALEINNTTYSFIANPGLITIIIIGNNNFGFFNLIDPSYNAIIGSFSNITIEKGNY